jgi:hypothetical protein
MDLEIEAGTLAMKDMKDAKDGLLEFRVLIFTRSPVCCGWYQSYEDILAYFSIFVKGF